jgi:hypothetical protein
MFSYLKIVQELVDQGVYARGVRAYLEGRVSKPVDKIMDFWREYQVFDRHTHKVVIPLFHLALDRKKWDKGVDAFVENVTCDCEFYEEYGVCKHIVSVCASIEDEFVPKKLSVSDEDEEVLDNIFLAQNQKDTRLWQSKIENYFEGSTNLTTFAATMVTSVNSDPNSYSLLLEFLKIQSNNALLDYQKEKRLIKLMIFVLGYGYKFWWDFFEDYFLKIEDKYLADLILDLWEFKIAGVSKNFDNELKEFFINLDESKKEEVINLIKTRYPNTSKMWIEFVFFAKAERYLSKNLDKLDPKTLLRAVEIIPEDAENIEIRIFNQLKSWIDFLVAGQYDELIEVFEMWKKTFGYSNDYQNAVKYLINSHPKKRNLIATVSKK